jgi:hypothetical protein
MENCSSTKSLDSSPPVPALISIMVFITVSSTFFLEQYPMNIFLKIWEFLKGLFGRKTEIDNMEKFEIKIQGDWTVVGMPFAPSWVAELPLFVKVGGTNVNVYDVLSLALREADKRDHEPNDGEFDIPTNTKLNLPLVGKVDVKGDIELSVRKKAQK